MLLPEFPVPETTLTELGAVLYKHTDVALRVGEVIGVFSACFKTAFARGLC